MGTSGMRIVVLTMGSRGDLQPFLALGSGLAARGHEVAVAGFAPFREDVERRGLAFRRLPGDADRVFADPAWARWRPSPWRPRAHARMLRTVLRPLGETTAADYDAACEGADAALTMVSTTPAQQVIADRGLRSVGLNYAPLHRTGEWGHLTLCPDLRAGRAINLLSHDVGDRLLAEPLRQPLRPRTRRGFGLPVNPYGPAAGDHASWPTFPVVHGFSEALVPRPADWPRHLHVTGSWMLPAEPDERLPAAVTAFLRSGPPPVYVGLGSLAAVTGAGDRVRLLVRTLRARGERVLVQPGPAGLDGVEDDDGVLAVGATSHALLFPRVRAVVHHGGAGTTATGLAAGAPTLVVPFVFDQHFWGRRVAAVGAGPPPLPAHRFTSARLHARLQALGRADVRAAARSVAERIRAEDGVARGAALVEHLLLEQAP